MDAMKIFPKGDIRLRTEKGTASHIKTDVFKEQMWYAYDGEAGIGTGLISMHPDRVREIIRMNKNGKKPADLNEYMNVTVETEPDYTNVVGQDDLNRFEHIFKKKKKRSGNRKKGGGQNKGGQPQGKGQQKRQAKQGNKQGGNQKNQKNQQNDSKGPKAEAKGKSNNNKRRNNNRRKKQSNNQGNQPKNQTDKK